MDSTRDLELSALLLGALDPARARIIEAQIRASPTLQTRLRALEAELSARESTTDADRWRVPVPWSSSAGLGVRLSVAPTLDAARVGDVYHVTLPAIPEPERRGVLVLRRDDALRWQVVFPAAPRDWIALSELEEQEGGRVLMITATGAPGPQRWAAAFPPLDTIIDWSAPESGRWAAVRAMLSQARIPVVSWDVLVVQDADADR